MKSLPPPNETEITLSDRTPIQYGEAPMLDLSRFSKGADMAYLTQTAMDFAHSQNWSNHTLGELYDALLESTGSTLPDAIEGASNELVDYWKKACKNQIDYLLYLYCDPLNKWPLDRSISECIRYSRGMKLNASTSQTLFTLYLNVYFNKYISAEISRLEEVARQNPSLSFDMVVDHFITTLVYEGIADQNPGCYLGFEALSIVPEGRKQSFRNIRNDILQAKSLGDRELMFRSIFLLMTYFAGSAYRRVHDAVTTILGISMANFRDLFFSQVPIIIAQTTGL